MPLDPEVAALLERQKNQPSRSSLDIAATREMMRRGAVLAGTAPALARIEDVVLSGSVRARQYWPALTDGLPLVVYFHGGRFISGDLESHDTVCRMLALSAGCRILAVDYRLAPEHRFPAAAEDARRAVEWAMREGAPVGVAGDSAGANLAAGVACAHRGGALRCQLLIYPMIDATCGSPSFAVFAEGYGPGAADMRRGWAGVPRGGKRPARSAGIAVVRGRFGRCGAGICSQRGVRHASRRGRSVCAQTGSGGQHGSVAAIPGDDPRVLHHAGRVGGGARSDEGCGGVSAAYVVRMSTPRGESKGRMAHLTGWRGRKMLKKLGTPLLALAAILAVAPAPAKAEVRFRVYLGAPVYTAPPPAPYYYEPYPYDSPYSSLPYYSYPPAYTYSRPIFTYPRDRDYHGRPGFEGRHEFREHGGGRGRGNGRGRR